MRCLPIFLLTVTTCMLLVHAAEDLYAVLGLKRTATEREIKKKFRSLSKQFHPDVNPEPAAKERYASIMKAYSVLEDPKKRENYDRFGVVDGDNDEQHRRRGGFNPFGFGFRNREYQPIQSATKTMSVTDYYDIMQYRGRHMHIVQVFHSQAPGCHLFAPAWEHLAFQSTLRQSATFWRIDHEKDHILLEIAGMFINEVPTVFAITDGHVWMIPQVPLSQNPVISVRPIEQYMQSLFSDMRSQLASNTVYNRDQLAGLVTLHATRVPLILVTNMDPNSDLLSVTLTSKFGDRAEVYLVAPQVLSEVFDACSTASRLRSTSVWIYHTTSTDLCSASRYPSSRLNDEDAIVDFISKRILKPVPILTNYSFDALCGRDSDEDDSVVEKPCAIEIAVGNVQKLAKHFERRRELLQPALVDALWEGLFLADFQIHATSLSTDEAHVLFLTREASPRFATFSGTPNAVFGFLDRALGGAVTLHAAPTRYNLRSNVFPMAMWRRFLTTATAMLSMIPGIELIGVVGFVWVVKLCIYGRPAPPRTANNPMRDEGKSAPNGSAPQATPVRGETRPGPASAERSRASEGRESATSSTGSRTWSGQTDRMAAQSEVRALPKTITTLRTADVQTATQSVRLLLVLAFAPAEGVKAPSDAANLLGYTDVLLRTVSLKRHPKWWDWLREHGGAELAHGEQNHSPVIVAVRAIRGVAAVMPPGRSLQMWVDAVLEGQVPLSTPVNVTAVTDDC